MAVVEAVKLLGVFGDQVELIDKLAENSHERKEPVINIFVLCSALTLLSDTSIPQKSELLIMLFDTNENYIIQDNEMHVLCRCCLAAIAKLTNKEIEIKTEHLEDILSSFKKQSRYVRDEGVSVNDFTQFLLNTPAILGFLNQYGLFL